MRNAYTAILFGCAIGFVAVGVVNSTSQIITDQTINQCETKDWPASKDAAMTEWCEHFMTEELPLMVEAGQVVRK